MAKKIVFESKLEKPYYTKVLVDVSFPKAWVRVPIKGVEAVNEAYKIRSKTDETPFEVSSVAKNELGNKLSAFNLKDAKGRGLECVFQSSKKFKYGGPYLDLLEVAPAKAKKIIVLKIQEN